MATYDVEILNVDLNKNVLVKVNVDGVQTLVLQADGSTGDLIVPKLRLGTQVPNYTNVTAATVVLTAESPDVVIVTPPGGGTTVTLPDDDIVIGRRFEIYNLHPSNVVIIKPSSGSVPVCRCLPGNRVVVMAIVDGPNTPTSWSVFSAKRQVAYGTEISSSQTVVSSSFTNFGVSLTFTAAFSGHYRIFAAVCAEPPSTSGESWGLRVEDTAGSSSAIWLPSTSSAMFETGGESSGPLHGWIGLERIDDLTAGTAYTYNLQGRTSAGSLKLRGDVQPAQIVAMSLD